MPEFETPLGYFSSLVGFRPGTARRAAADSASESSFRRDGRFRDSDSNLSAVSAPFSGSDIESDMGMSEGDESDGGSSLSDSASSGDRSGFFENEGAAGSSNDLTAVSSASKLNVRDFNRAFRNSSIDPRSETLLKVFSCALSREILHQGKMYVTSNYICFNSRIFNVSHKICLPFRDITMIEPRRIINLFPNSIEIGTLDGSRYIFASFTNRNGTLEFLRQLRKRVEQPHQHLSRTSSNATHKGYGLTASETDDEAIPRVNIEQVTPYSPFAASAAAAAAGNSSTTDLTRSGSSAAKPPLPRSSSTTSLAEPSSPVPGPASGSAAAQRSANSSAPTRRHRSSSTGSGGTPGHHHHHLLLHHGTNNSNNNNTASTTTNNNNITSSSSPSPSSSQPIPAQSSSNSFGHNYRSEAVDLFTGKKLINSMSQMRNSGPTPASRSRKNTPSSGGGSIPHSSSTTNVAGEGQQHDGSSSSSPSTAPATPASANGGNGGSSSSSNANAAAAKASRWPVKNLGPEEHAPTPLPEPRENEKVLAEETIQAPPGVVANIVFGSDTSWYKRFLLDVDKNRDLGELPPFPALQAGTERKFEYVKPLSGPVGPKQTRCKCTERIDKWDMNGYVEIVTTTLTPDVPAGSSFSTQTRAIFAWGDNNTTVLRLGTWLEWTGKTWLKVAIEKGAVDGQTSYCKSLAAEITKTVSRSKSKAFSSGGGDGGDAASAVAVKPSTKSRHVASGDSERKSSSTSSDTARKAAEAIAAWERICMGLLLAVVVLFVLVIYFWRKSRHAVPAFGDSQRDLFRIQQELELWQWMDDRQRARALPTRSVSEASVLEAIALSEKRLDRLKRSMGAHG